MIQFLGYSLQHDNVKHGRQRRSSPTIRAETAFPCLLQLLIAASSAANAAKHGHILERRFRCYDACMAGAGAKLIWNPTSSPPFEPP